ncbi:MAG: phasin family protein [Alphaproteobacteria bacterium]|nr:MAG: phasin family protein [Alphaproteobacteria bacterium]
MAKAQSKTGNPFLDGEFGDFMDFTKFAEQFKLPGIDTKALFETQRRNLEAMTRANRVALEGLQAIAQRQVEILRQAMDEATKAVRELTKPGQPTEKLVAQTELVKEAYELALANLRELAEITAKSNTEAADVLTHRFADSLDELKGVIKTVEAANGSTAK